MKTLTLYCDKDLVFRWNEWPEKPERATEPSLAYFQLLDKYNAALEVAKRDSIAFEDQDYITKLLGFRVEPDTFYSFPFEGEVKAFEMPTIKLKGQGYHINKSKPEKFVRLIPESKQESQEDDFNVWMEYGKLQLQLSLEAAEKKEDNPSKYVFEKLSKHYRLTRKHP
jgi:hypothetical protein